MKALVSIGTAFFLLFLSVAAQAISIGNILGQVTEKETGKPVAYAAIVFENYYDKIEVTANEYGYYYANHVPTGRYQMRLEYNNRTFIMNRVRVYDSYASMVDIAVSSNNQIAGIVELERKEPIISAVTPTDIVVTDNSGYKGIQSLSEILSTQPGIDVVDGKLYIKGSDQVRYFIDGTPVLGNATIARVW